MNLNDPFGRMQARRQKDYESLRNSLQKAGINSRDEAEALLQSTRKRGLIAIALLLPATILLVMFFPEARAVWIALGGILVLWFARAIRSGQTYIRRYIDEELRANNESAEASSQNRKD